MVIVMILKLKTKKRNDYKIFFSYNINEKNFRYNKNCR